MSYGATVVSLRVPDRDGHADDVVLGHQSLEGYLAASPYFGGLIGRYANRIAGGRFLLDGIAYTLSRNDGGHHLHGGHRGFDKVVWRCQWFERPRAVGATFSYLSRDGEEGYPGNLAVQATYTLTDRNRIVLDLQATTDRPTPVNLTPHSYFNLAGSAAADVLDHQLAIDADRFIPVDATLIPTGTLAVVAGTPFDFRQPVAIGERIAQEHDQLAVGGGFDHTFVLNRKQAGLSIAARLFEPTTGRSLELATTEPGVQFYSGNFLDGTIEGKRGRRYGPRSGLCLEPQHFPDSPNRPSFPSTILRPGREYRSQTVLSFSILGPAEKGALPSARGAR